ncbi:hypothetical protein AVEN_114020-1 [Araneus ventricosus]|uniref:Uncharacterized protein n=1 Tax=Araneus ventricosus TaxID=182803 RepID=A0A4Y2RKK4_ARAVE|nr:hypothetical protein AVEN_114020-1 [Araneus ventricosus]
MTTGSYPPSQNCVWNSMDNNDSCKKICLSLVTSKIFSSVVCMSVHILGYEYSNQVFCLDMFPSELTITQSPVHPASSSLSHLTILLFGDGKSLSPVQHSTSLTPLPSNEFQNCCFSRSNRTFYQIHRVASNLVPSINSSSNTNLQQLSSSNTVHQLTLI